MTSEPSLPDDPLTRNLLALFGTKSDLVERIHLPVEGNHLTRDEAGRWIYRLHGSAFDLACPDEAARALVEGVLATGDPADPLLVFGLGTGDLLDEVLRQAPESRVVAWDRDPWVLRQALIEHDWSAAIASGRLRLALHADLVELAERGHRWKVVDHPLLAGVYHHERAALEQGLREERALLCVGGLFVDSVADSLRRAGYSVLSLDTQRLATEELELAIRQYRPQLVVGINYVNGMAEFCEAHQLDYLCWEIDPTTDPLARLAGPTPRSRIFTYREANAAAYREAGFEHVEYLPLAADPDRRRPMALGATERENYGAPISFVGSSMVAKVEEFRRIFVDYHEAWKPGCAEAASASFAAVVTAQREDFTTCRIPELLEAILPGFRDHCLRSGRQDPVMLAAEVSAAEKRLNYVAELAGSGIEVWGDAGWKLVESQGVAWRGPALHETEVPRIYGASAINLDVGRLYQSDIVTMRIFDILACGGFVLAEHSPALEELFAVGVEVESYRGLDQLRAKVAHYLAHPEEARAIAERGREAVLERHVIEQRVRHMLRSLEPAERAVV